MTDKRQYNSASVTAQVSALANMKMAELWLLWDEHFTRRPGTWSRDYVMGRIAYKIQEAAYGGIDPDVKRRLVRMGEKHTRMGHANSAEAMLLPGATLIRSHGGNEHRVVVTPDGQYEYKGQVFEELVDGGAPHHWHALVGPRLLWLEEVRQGVQSSRR